MTAILEGRNIVKTFAARRGGHRHEVRAVNDVSVSVDRGEIVGLVGESGCGKTTFSRILIGIEAASAGTVLHDGRPVATKAAWKALRRDIQYVFQDPYTSLCPTMRIGDALAEPLLVHGIGDRSDRAQRVREALSLVGLQGFIADRLPSQLSGGQRQRVSLARALMIRPRVLICDEIVSGLDVSVQAQVLTLLTELQASLGLGLIFISHDLRVVRYLCDCVVVMYRGEIVEQGPVDDVFGAPAADYTRQLLAAIPDHSRRGEPRLGRPSPAPGVSEVGRLA